MNWTGGRLRRHSELNDKSRKQTFGKSSAPSKGPHQITLFSSLARHQGVDKRRGQVGNRTSNPTGLDPRAVPFQPQSSSNTTGTHESKPPNHLEQMKRQLLETTDWGAVRAARPVQVSFTPQEDLERFGKRRRLTKNDHERLNISKMPRLSLREEIPSEGDIPKNLEIRINGHRLGQHDTGINEETPLDIVSSQSMLLDDESLDSNHRFDIRVSLPSNSATRSASKLSMLSNGSQLCYISDVPDKTNSASDARGNPMHNQDTSEWMDWISDEHMLQGLQSNESSSIIPHAESPVRRRFTIDEQAIADREGRFKFPSPGAEPWITQFLHEGSYGACVRSPIKPSSQMGARIALGQCDNMAGPPSSNFPHFSWLPWPYPDGQRAGNNEYGAGTSMPPIQDYTNLSRSSVSGEQVIPLTIYGQPVVFQSIDMEIDVDQANASFAPSCRSQTREAQIPFRYTGSLSG